MVIVHTGDGKGKTTAALGLAMRAVGNGMKVIMLQFLKGKWKPGERKAAEKLAPLFEIRPLGRGFTWESENIAQDIESARKAWEESRKIVLAGEYDVVILDEINYVVGYDFLPVEEVLTLIREKPPAMHLVLTGRRAHPKVIEAADLVTEMVAIKHPFEKGIKGQRGIEF
ncbi:MAG: cob(I)yrinic acid a,c-diamide adenosyltransferase [Candidatus Latescibacteria bacterium]|nr:cob(I)yrinic acid a,c-diamide adenosyltransferase [Candidatus Latescibacterota bacterium]